MRDEAEKRIEHLTKQFDDRDGTARQMQSEIDDLRAGGPGLSAQGGPVDEEELEVIPTDMAPPTVGQAAQMRQYQVQRTSKPGTTP